MALQRNAGQGREPGRQPFLVQSQKFLCFRELNYGISGQQFTGRGWRPYSPSNGSGDASAINAGTTPWG